METLRSLPVLGEDASKIISCDCAGLLTVHMTPLPIVPVSDRAHDVAVGFIIYYKNTGDLTGQTPYSAGTPVRA